MVCLPLGLHALATFYQLLPDKNDYTYLVESTFFLFNFQDWSPQFC